MYSEFEDSVVVVTGATKGLGRAIADGFARWGARLVVTSRSQEDCDIVADELASDGRRPLAIACDMGDEAAIDAAVDRIHDELGTVSVLVNNAGFNPGPNPGPVERDVFDRVFATNVFGPVHLAEKVIPRMLESGAGSIVNITTVGAYRGAFPVSVYGASKAALLSYTRSLAMQYGSTGVRVNAISPGPFRTPMMDELAEAIPGFYDFAAQANEMGRVGDPAELVPAVLYLASSHASFVTGEDHVVAGGFFR